MNKMRVEKQKGMAESVAIIFGKRLQEIRKEMQLTQKQMADNLMVAESTYANWEQGRREPNLWCLIVIKNTLKISFDELLDFDKY